MSNEIADIRERLARIETTQNHHSAAIEDGFDALGKKLDQMDGRLRGVEVKSGTLGALAGTIMSVGTSLVMAKLTGKG